LDLKLQVYNSVLKLLNIQLTEQALIISLTLAFEQTKKDDFLLLSGNHSVFFADFELEAPQRMLGLVKVQGDLRVEFKLLIRPIVD
jgi:hypothetical protein